MPPYRKWETKLRKDGTSRALARMDACAHPRPYGGERINNLYEVRCRECGAALRTYALERDGEWKLIHARKGHEPKGGGDYGP